MNAYLDIDGVLLGKFGDQIVLAEGAEALIDYLLTHYTCYWLTTHCRGDADGPLAYLSQYATEAFLGKLHAFRATDFDVYKTEAIDFSEDFIWVDDAPLHGEIRELETRGRLDAWKRVNTYVEPKGLTRLLRELKKI